MDLSTHKKLVEEALNSKEITVMLKEAAKVYAEYDTLSAGPKAGRKRYEHIMGLRGNLHSDFSMAGAEEQIEAKLHEENREAHYHQKPGRNAAEFQEELVKRFGLEAKKRALVAAQKLQRELDLPKVRQFVASIKIERTNRALQKRRSTLAGRKRAQEIAAEEAARPSGLWARLRRRFWH